MTRAQLDLASAVQEVASDDGNVKNAYIVLGFVLNATVKGPLSPPADTLRRGQPAGAVDPLVAFAEAHRPDLIVKYSAKAAHLFADELLLRIAPTLGVTAGRTGSTLRWGAATTATRPLSGR